MIAPLRGWSRSRLRCEDGFSLMELLIAILLLSIAIIALVTTFDSSRRVVDSAERTEEATRVAQDAIEAASGRPYTNIALPCNPTLASGTGACVGGAWANVASASYRGTVGANEPLVVDTANGRLQSQPQPWYDSRSSTLKRGDVYTFVTCANGTAAECMAGTAHKRIVVAVTLSKGPPNRPILLSTLAVDPRSGTGRGTSPCTQGECQTQ